MVSGRARARGVGGRSVCATVGCRDAGSPAGACRRRARVRSQPGQGSTRPGATVGRSRPRSREPAKGAVPRSLRGGSPGVSRSHSGHGPREESLKQFRAGQSLRARPISFAGGHPMDMMTLFVAFTGAAVLLQALVLLAMYV